MKSNPIAFIVVLLIIQAIIGLGHFFVYKTIVRFFNIVDPTAIAGLGWTFLVLSLSFIVTTILGMKFYGQIIHVLYTGASVWLGTVYWLMLAAAAIWIIHGLIKFVAPSFSTEPIAIILLIAAIATSAYGVWNSYQTRVRELTVHLHNLPEQWRGRKAVVVADTHLGNLHMTAFAEKIVRLINDQNPDIVLFAGDAYDGTIADFVSLAAPYKNIASTFGTYFAAGNHEEFGEEEPFFNGLRAANMHILDNRMESVDGLQVAGISYRDGSKSEREEAVLANMKLNPDIASVLIKHSPTHIDTAEEAGIGLQVSGHTHVGQMWPFNYVTKRIFGDFYYGLAAHGGIHVYTTSGAGTWGPPQRVGTEPEIAVITFEK